MTPFTFRHPPRKLPRRFKARNSSVHFILSSDAQSVGFWKEKEPLSIMEGSSQTLRSRSRTVPYHHRSEPFRPKSAEGCT